MKKTCGIYLINKNGNLLITHPTNFPDLVWSIPKGEPDEGDDSLLDTAIRELFEETGIDLHDKLYDKKLVAYYLDSAIYSSRKKILYPFLVIDNTLDNVPVVCSSHFEANDGKIYPENDDYKWIHISEYCTLQTHLIESQRSNLDKIIEIFNKKNYESLQAVSE